MKKAIYYLLFSVISYFSFGQVKISGKFKNAPKHAILKITYFNNPIEWTEISASKTKLDYSGSFAVNFEWEKAASARLTVADQYTDLFLVPGDSVNVTCDYIKFDKTIRYSGRGAAENNYLSEDLSADFITKANSYTAFNDADKFKIYIDSLEKLNIAFFESHKSSDFSEEFRNYIGPTIKYRFITPRYMYRLGYNAVTSKFFDKPVPENYFSFLRKIDLDDEQAFDNSNYTEALMRYLEEIHDSKIGVSDSLSEFQQAEIRTKENYNYRKTIFRGKVLDYQLTTYIKDYIKLSTSNTKFTDSLLRDYKTVCKNADYIEIIDKLYLKANKLSAGSPAPDFSLRNISGKIISLSALKGKVVFIDFWATWCMPCIVAMPQTNKLMQNFNGNNHIIFLNINVYDEISKWQNHVAKQKMRGENLYASKEQSDQIFKMFNFDGIPHYILIDKEGKIIDANADNSAITEKKIINA